VASSSEHDVEPSGSIEFQEFLEHPIEFSFPRRAQLHGISPLVNTASQ
jgi:hypothetical protein